MRHHRKKGKIIEVNITVFNEGNMETLKQSIINFSKYIIDWPLQILSLYGLTGMLALATIPIKLFLFYSFIGITTNLISVWLFSCFFTFVLLSSFKNKWIPAILYLLITVLMFADVTYSSFFNRYLSLNMLGAAGFLGDIVESIKEVLRPHFALLFMDNLLIFMALFQSRNQVKPNTEDGFLLFLKQQSQVKSQNISKEETLAKLEKKKTPKTILSVFNSFVDFVDDHKAAFIALITIMILLGNFSTSKYVTSLSNQEIYTYHINDLLKAATGTDVSGVNGIASFDNSYEREKRGPLFGIGKDKNLIVIQMESFQNFVIGKSYNGQELTPNLNKLIQDKGTLYFDNFYQQVGSGNTSDAELAINHSIYGSLTSYSYKNHQDNYYRGLPALLKDKGYTTSVFHAFWDKSFWNRENIYPNIGFDTFYGGVDNGPNSFRLTKNMGWGLTDDEFFNQSIEFMKQIPQPFYNFMITLSNHHPFKMLDEYTFIQLAPEDQGTLVGNYLNSVAFTDYAIGQFIERLKTENLYDNTIIALYGDHLGLTLNDPDISQSMGRLLGKPYDYEDMMKVPLIIHIPGTEEPIQERITISAGQLDFLPTMAYLMGFESLDTIYLGHNALTIGSGFVAEQTYMTKGSFFQDDIVYEMSRDGVFENGRAYNQKTGMRVPIEDCYQGYLRSMDIINASEYIMKNDVIKKMFLDGQEPDKVFKEPEALDYPQTIAFSGVPYKNLIGTNSLEALNASYDAGYRAIRVDINWTSEVGARTAILLRDWKEFPLYFESDVTQEMTIEQFQSTPMRNDLTSMDFFQLADWMVEHPDVVIVANVDRSADFFMKILGEYNESVIPRMIPEVQGMVEYSGLYNGILNMEKGNFSYEQILEFMKLNNVWAGAMSGNSAEEKYKKFLKSDFTIYIYEAENGLLKKAN